MSTVSKVTHIDLRAHTITVMPPEGAARTLKVADPAEQMRLKNLRVGQTVKYDERTGPHGPEIYSLSADLSGAPGAE
ncbi:hypothetical protein [Streptomyces sp. NPDC051567]|uniref:hypothetical protein n=1 Tax=Streptomyces sp. NPDC051567 TaxID=3365660 RepID=UPI0037919A77